MWTQNKELRGLTVWLVIAMAIAVAFAIAMLHLEDSILANVAFFVAGGLLITIVELVRDAIRRPIQARDLARAIYGELANRVARCVFDFEDPWERWLHEKNCGPTEVDILRLRKFIPVSPIIYPATCTQFGLLSGRTIQAIIRFYVTLAIYQKDMEHVANHHERHSLFHVQLQQVAFLAERLRRTLSPGLDALRELSSMVEDYEELDAVAIRDADALFKHARAHLTLRQRIEHYANEARDG